MDTQIFWAPVSGWCRVDACMACEEPKPVELAKVDPFQPLHSNSAPWLDLSSLCPESAPGCSSWYASPTDSEGPQTSDLSPVSGYFEWSHSSNNNSPLQYDEIVDQASPSIVHHPSRGGCPDEQSPFVASYPHIRQPSCQEAPDIVKCRSRHPFAADIHGTQEITIPTGQDSSTIVTHPASSSLKTDQLSRPDAAEKLEHDESAHSRSGKRWKAAHRAVERRYRSNLNLKIIKLGQCIPAIRRQIVGIDGLDGKDECRTTPKSKLQKGHVLSKAVDYIQSLQELVSELETEKMQLEDRVEELNRIVEEHLQIPLVKAQYTCAPEASRRFSEPQPSSDSRFREVKTEVGTEYRSSEAQFSEAPPQNGFSFVSENPSLTSKRTRAVRSGV